MKEGGPKPAFQTRRTLYLEQAEHVLVGLRRERQSGGAQLLAGLQGEEVCSFLVRVGESEVRRTGFEDVDHRLGEVLTGLDDREVRAELRCLDAQRLDAGLEVVKGRIDRDV